MKLNIRKVVDALYALEKPAITRTDFDQAAARLGIESNTNRWELAKRFMQQDGYESRRVRRQIFVMVHKSISEEQWNKVVDSASMPPVPKKAISLRESSQRLHDALKKTVARAEAALPMEAPFWDWRAADLPF